MFIVFLLCVLVLAIFLYMKKKKIAYLKKVRIYFELRVSSSPSHLLCDCFIFFTLQHFKLLPSHDSSKFTRSKKWRAIEFEDIIATRRNGSVRKATDQETMQKIAVKIMANTVRSPERYASSYTSRDDILSCMFSTHYRKNSRG